VPLKKRGKNHEEGGLKKKSYVRTFGLMIWGKTEGGPRSKAGNNFLRNKKLVKWRFGGEKMLKTYRGDRWAIGKTKRGDTHATLTLEHACTEKGEIDRLLKA